MREAFSEASAVFCKAARSAARLEQCGLLLGQHFGGIFRGGLFEFALTLPRFCNGAALDKLGRLLVHAGLVHALLAVGGVGLQIDVLGGDRIGLGLAGVDGRCAGGVRGWRDGLSLLAGRALGLLVQRIVALVDFLDAALDRSVHLVSRGLAHFLRIGFDERVFVRRALGSNDLIDFLAELFDFGTWSRTLSERGDEIGGGASVGLRAGLGDSSTSIAHLLGCGRQSGLSRSGVAGGGLSGTDARLSAARKTGRGIGHLDGHDAASALCGRFGFAFGLGAFALRGIGAFIFHARGGLVLFGRSLSSGRGRSSGGFFTFGRRSRFRHRRGGFVLLCRFFASSVSGDGCRLVGGSGSNCRFLRFWGRWSGRSGERWRGLRRRHSGNRHRLRCEPWRNHWNRAICKIGTAHPGGSARRHSQRRRNHRRWRWTRFDGRQAIGRTRLCGLGACG